MIWVLINICSIYSAGGTGSLFSSFFASSIELSPLKRTFSDHSRLFVTIRLHLSNLWVTVMNSATLSLPALLDVCIAAYLIHIFQLCRKLRESYSEARILSRASHLYQSMNT